jgi:hypothetical protein
MEIQKTLPIKLFHVIYVMKRLSKRGELLDAMMEYGGDPAVAGISLDEFCLGRDRISQERFRWIQDAFKEFKLAHPKKLIHSWVGYVLTKKDPRLVWFLHKNSRWISPEIYLKPGERLSFQDFFELYPFVNPGKVLMGLVTHRDWMDDFDQWLVFFESQVTEVKRLGCKGVALWAPDHLRSAEQRKAVDEVLSAPIP